MDYNEIVRDGNISFLAITEDGKITSYEIFMAVENGSGVTVTGETKEEVIKALSDYLLDELTELDESTN